MTFEERRDILSKSSLEVGDIIKLEEVCQKTAQGIMRKCKILFNGGVKFNTHRITTDSYLQYTGLEKGSWYKLQESYQRGTNNHESQ